jgi:hypothetical protein
MTATLHSTDLDNDKCPRCGVVLTEFPHRLIMARAEIERLRAALKPFADDADHVIEIEAAAGWPEDVPLLSDGKITLADYRRAKAAFYNEQSAPEGK